MRRCIIGILTFLNKSMTIFWIIVAVAITYLLVKQSQSSKQENTHNISTNSREEEKEVEITEEMVFRAQSAFETKLREETEFPDAISGDETYIYRNLMLGWFNKLAAKNRYDESLTKKLRGDWLDYMESVSDRSTYNYLSNEFWDEKDNSKSEAYREKHILASRKMFAIQDAFAAAIGKEAVTELAKIKAMDFMQFSRHGELAPEGYKWDLGRREIEPDKKTQKKK